MTNEERQSIIENFLDYVDNLRELVAAADAWLDAEDNIDAGERNSDIRDMREKAREDYRARRLRGI